MASFTIRNLDDEVKRLLRIRAAASGRSIEEEARQILRATLGVADALVNLTAAILARVAAAGGTDFDLPGRGPMRRRQHSIRADLVERKGRVTFEPLAL